MDEQTVVLAPAKLNLALHVTGRRADGYHLLDSLVAFTRFGDRVTVAPSDEDRFEMTGPYAAGLPADDGNLAVRALNAMRAEFGHPEPVSITLEKNLPVASGVGGGSSDAAAVMRGLAALWHLPTDRERLARVGIGLGADVPMCLAARPLLARGIGDEISPVDGFPSLGIVLVNPGVGVSTAAVFAALTRSDSAPLPPLPSHIDFHTLCNWLETTRNDLEAPARTFEPAINGALSALKKAGAHFVRMSGSGATCFGLFESGNLAKRAASEIRTRRPGWFVAATRNTSQDDAP
nr:4-(cytidine 5'-diphospho)-2-C-methyl-D-erythritol kinase [Mesorhizobium sp.]